MKINFDLKGLEKAITEVASYADKKTDGVKQIVKEYAQSIEQDAKSRVSVDDGETKESIKAFVFNNGLSATIAPRKPGGWKARWIEYGTAPRYTKTGKYVGRMPAQPFMFPAAEVNRPKYLRDLENEMRKLK